MRYTVRSAEGELSFGSRQELFGAYRQGLVAEDDEVREEGATAWRKARALLGSRPGSGRSLPLAQWLRVAVLVGVGGVALSLVASGEVARMALGAVLALMLVLWMFTWTRGAFALKRRR